MEAEFRYDAHDPFAVSITFHLGDDTAVRWELARTLLVRAITDPAGAGDVCLWPNLDAEYRAVVLLSLGAPQGELVVEIRTNQLYRFLTRTLAMVPFGTESEWLDVDAVVAQLLGSSAQ